MIEGIRHLAEQGDAKAQNAIAVCYQSGRGIQPDQAKAFQWFRKSALQGYAAAQHALGVCYLSGDGCQRSIENALMWFQQSADQNDPQGMGDLGFLYYAVGNNEKALLWLTKAGDHNYTHAQFTLAALYGAGECVNRDPEKAASWMKKAANAGHKAAVACQKGEADAITLIHEIKANMLQARSANQTKGCLSVVVLLVSILGTACAALL
jgi:TPR repeat protein